MDRKKKHDKLVLLGSGEDTQHPENFYPRKIVLKKNVDVGSRYGEFGFIKEAAVNNGAANLKEET